MKGLYSWLAGLALGPVVRHGVTALLAALATAGVLSPEVADALALVLKSFVW